MMASAYTYTYILACRVTVMSALAWPAISLNEAYSAELKQRADFLWTRATLIVEGVRRSVAADPTLPYQWSNTVAYDFISPTPNGTADANNGVYLFDLNWMPGNADAFLGEPQPAQITHPDPSNLIQLATSYNTASTIHYWNFLDFIGWPNVLQLASDTEKLSQNVMIPHWSNLHEVEHGGTRLLSGLIIPSASQLSLIYDPSTNNADTSDSPRGSVTSIDPPAGTSVPKGTRIVVNYSLGPGESSLT